MERIKKEKKLHTLGIMLFWLLLWQAVAIYMDNAILLAGPWEVGRAFFQNMWRSTFWLTVLHSLGRIGLGFLAALLLASVLGALSYRYFLLEEFLSPMLTVIKSIPVASFVVLLLIWFGSARLSFFISFLIAFPNIYVNTLAGLRSTDGKLLEMAEIFEVKGLRKFLYIYRPALMPYLCSSIKVSLGMSWKAGVAAEVIGIPADSLGEKIYMSKIYLDTAGLLAWTMAVILFSFLSEKAVLYLAEQFARWKIRQLPSLRREKGMSKTGGEVQGLIKIQNLSKAYGEKTVFYDFSRQLQKGKRYCLMAPSGTGKTTLLRLLNHLERPDSGQIEGMPEHSAMVFQEDRLCEEYHAIDNLLLTTGKSRETVWKYACKILPEECLKQPVQELSGGMKRRVAILRALLSDSAVIMLDEPFTGLDEENRKRTADFILELLSERTLIVATHRLADVELLGAELLELT